MLRKCDGFDLADAVNVKLKYLGYNASFDQNTLVAGRDGFGHGFAIVNTAFGFASYFDLFTMPASAWGWHCDIQIKQARFADTTIYEWIASASTITPVQLVLRLQLDGRLRLVNGFNGATVATSVGALSLDTWYTFEVSATFGGSGVCTVKVNGATFLSGAGFGDGGLPDTLGFRYETFGPPALELDNYVLWDNTDDSSHFVAPSFPGRLRVDSLLPTSDVIKPWAAVPGPNAYAMVNDDVGRAGGSPDGDSTYITPAGSTRTQFFNMAPSPCYGAVYGLALNACARPAGPAYPLNFRCQIGNTPFTLGSQTPPNSAYRTIQALAAFRPDNGDVWNDPTITDAYWGLSTNAAALARVTAFYLEKITSLTPQPFDCGSSSYSF